MNKKNFLPFFIIFLFLTLNKVTLAGPRSFQIGDHGKNFVTKDWLDSTGKSEYKATFSTAEIIFKDQNGYASGTGFYIGKFSGVHILVTNNHVIPNDQVCNNVGAIFFPFSKDKIKCKRLIRTWKSIDTSFIEIELSEKFEKFLSDKALSFDFSQSFERQLVYPSF